jgi:AI-2 transport protein TqsA
LQPILGMAQGTLMEDKAEARTASPADRRAPEPGRAPGAARARLLAVVATVLVIAFLKWSSVATMPLAFALFLIALAWPVQERLERRLPRWAAFSLTVLALLLVIGLFIGALVWSGETVAERAPQYAGKVQTIYRQVQAWARDLGLSLPAGPRGGGGGFGAGLAKRVVAALSSSISLILLIVAFAILGLLEVRDFQAKSMRAFRDRNRGERLAETVRTLVAKYQRYILARTIAAVLQGVSYWLFALLVGLDFALLWGLLAFLLNYIPTLGSALAVIPLTLFALVQFDGFGRPLLVFAGAALLQILMGNYLDPLIEGRLVSLSPLVVLVSIMFWGWVWGIPGAFLGVPITIGIVIVADHFPTTRWIACLLGDTPEEHEKEA